VSGWSMQLDTGNQFAVVHAECPTGPVIIRAVKVVSGTDADAKEAAGAMADTLSINLDDVYVVPAGSLTKAAKRSRHAKD
jgi:hypothetical protein